MPIFHAFTGRDTVSPFSGKGKKSASQTWTAYSALTGGFKPAVEGNLDEVLPIFEKFVVAMYDRYYNKETFSIRLSKNISIRFVMVKRHNLYIIISWVFICLFLSPVRARR